VLADRMDAANDATDGVASMNAVIIESSTEALSEIPYAFIHACAMIPTG